MEKEEGNDNHGEGKVTPTSLTPTLSHRVSTLIRNNASI